MANRHMDLELEDFTYDDDGIPVPLPVSSSTLRVNNNNTEYKQNRIRKNGVANGPTQGLVITDVESENRSVKPKAKSRSQENKRYKDHSPVNDILDTSSSSLPDVETIRLDSHMNTSRNKPHVNVKNVEYIDNERAKEHKKDTVEYNINNEREKEHKKHRHKSKRSKESKKDLTPSDTGLDFTHSVPEVVTSISDSKYEHFDKKPKSNKSKSPQDHFVPGPRPHNFTEVQDNSWEGDLQAMFDIDGEGYDVSLTATQLILKPMGPKSRRKNKRRGSGLLRSASRASLSNGSAIFTDDTGSEIIKLKNVICAKINRRQTPNSSEGICMGFIVTSFTSRDENRLRMRHVLLDHPSESLSEQWVNRIKTVLNGLSNRPKRVKIFLQSHAGKKLGEGLYNTHVVPLFESAGIERDLTNLMYNEHVKQEMVHMDLDNYDCIMCVGGDGTVRQVTAGLLTRSQEKQNLSMKKGFSPVKAALPIAIVASGTTNQIAYSVMGTDDPITGIIHAVLGHSSPVDVCSVYSDEKFQTWTFTSQYGFAANVVKFSDRYKILGGNRLDAAFLKALTKAKLRPYECDVDYIPSPNIETSHTNDGVVCVRGCEVCKSDGDRDSVTSDIVEDYDPLANSSTSSTFLDLTENDPWKHCKGEYYNVSVLALPSRASFAPQGLSKFTHLNDGCMDLILVKNTVRKEFVRYLRRHGGSKNQLDLPFVEVHRVKEVKFRPRLPITWNYKDYNYSEIDYEMSKVEKRLKDKTKSMNEINLDDSDDDDSNDDDEIQKVKPRSHSMNFIDEDSDDSDTDSTPSSNDNNKTKTPSRKPSTVSQQTVTNPDPRRYRMSFTDQEILRRRKKQAKKDEKKKAKEESKMKSMWSFDTDLFKDNLVVDIKVHQGLVRICSGGVSPDTDLEDAKLSCLPVMVL